MNYICGYFVYFFSLVVGVFITWKFWDMKSYGTINALIVRKGEKRYLIDENPHLIWKLFVVNVTHGSHDLMSVYALTDLNERGVRVSAIHGLRRSY